MHFEAAGITFSALAGCYILLCSLAVRYRHLDYTNQDLKRGSRSSLPVSITRQDVFYRAGEVVFWHEIPLPMDAKLFPGM